MPASRVCSCGAALKELDCPRCGAARVWGVLKDGELVAVADTRGVILSPDLLREELGVRTSDLERAD